jgi:hypothetical protein
MEISILLGFHAAGQPEAKIRTVDNALTRLFAFCIGRRILVRFSKKEVLFVVVDMDYQLSG